MASTNSNATSMASLPSNYAAAMAGLAGYPYAQQAGTSAAAVAQAYMNQAAAAAHYPTYAAQYNAAAMAAGYWPQTGNASPQAHEGNQSSTANSGRSPNEPTEQ